MLGENIATGSSRKVYIHSLKLIFCSENRLSGISGSGNSIEPNHPFSVCELLVFWRVNMFPRRPTENKPKPKRKRGLSHIVSQHFSGVDLSILRDSLIGVSDVLVACDGELEVFLLKSVITTPEN